MNPNRLKNSFKDALMGVKYVFGHEQNFRLQILTAFVAICVSFFFKLGRQEWVIILFLIFLVLGLELVNTVMEKFLDIMSPRLHYQVKIIKDIMASIVFLAALCSLLIGFIIFFPKMVELYTQIML